MRPSLYPLAGVLAACLLHVSSSSAAELRIELPLARTAYQTNERIDLAVVRGSGQELQAGDLVLTVAGTDDGSRMTFTFPAAGAPVQNTAARATEHLHINGWLLRPGRYAIEAAVDGQSATVEISVHSHIRKSSYKLINWGRATGDDQLVQGEDDLGFNLFYGHYGNDEQANFIRAGVDYMSNCVMSGGHQMDLRMECDWSDPYVVRGGTRRAARRAFIDRTRPNVQGVHFYDEPGLTWQKDPETGEMTPHMIPAQVRAFVSAFGRDPLHPAKVDPQNPDHVQRWKQWAKWKLGFMDAAWKDAQFGVSYVRPDYLSLTQSQYGFSAFTDGYYFNVVRSLPVTSGHGGYHDYGLGLFNPSLTLELARARDFEKPCWYLPTWYGNTTSDQYRLEQYLSFQTNIQGMMCPPDIDPFKPESKPAAQGVVETNKLMQRLGPIFTTLPVTRPPVAMLYSLSHNLDKQAHDRKFAYAHADDHGAHVYFTYLAGKLLQQQFLAVVDEDVADGTLAANHRAIVLTSINHLDSEVITALEQFAAAGGLVLKTSDSQVQIEGATDLGFAPRFADYDQIKALQAEGKHQEAGKMMTLGHSLDVAQKLAAAIRPHLDRAGIEPVFQSDQPGICATRQAAGDIEYLFAVNGTHDRAAHPLLGMQAVSATIAMADDGRPLYDAVLGGATGAFTAQDGQLKATLRFGPGQMRVYARTARPIGAVRVGAPVVRRDYTAAQQPVQVTLSAALLDVENRLLSGSAPLEIRLTDPLGQVRYELYRATDQGTLQLSLPLAANDPAGSWTVSVRELLGQTEESVEFAYEAATSCAAVAGRTRRAVCFGDDLDNIYRFFRVHQDVTIVTGSSPYNAAAAERLAGVVKPWGVRCKIVDAASVNKPRSLSEEEAATWVGLSFGRVKPGGDNPPAAAGFDIRGAVVLLGTPEDNPLIAFLKQERFLPYQPQADVLPGRGRSLLAWQRDGIGAGQESVALIAYDEAGIQDAVGATYEAAAGLRPLTPLEQTARNTIAPASKAEVLPGFAVAWQAALPDRVVALTPTSVGIAALTHDGTESTLLPSGEIRQQAVLEGEAYDRRLEQLRSAQDEPAKAEAQKQAGPRLVKLVQPYRGNRGVAYWGGRVEIRDAGGKVLAAHLFSQDVTALATLGEHLLVGLADGRVVAMRTRN